MSHEALGDEADAFLAGRLADHLIASGRRLPPWACLNLLAHGSRHELAQALHRERGWRTHPSISDQQWLDAKRRLLERLLDATSGSHELRRIQEAALIPLELRLIREAPSGRLSPALVMERARQALDEHLAG